MSSSLVETLDTLEDPRGDRTQRHHRTGILVLAVICGADRFVAIALFDQLNEEWLRAFLALPHGIPSYDTLGRVFARLDAARFEEGFRDWVQNTFALTNDQVVLIDGQSVCGSHDRGRGLAPRVRSAPGSRQRWTTSPMQARSCCAFHAWRAAW